MQFDTSRFSRIPRSEKYDLVVIGSGPGGQRAAVQAAKLGKSALVIERQLLGGACLHLGTIPSKALREAALAATRERDALLPQVLKHTRRVVFDECAVIENQLERNHVDFICGTAEFVDPHIIQIKNERGQFKVFGDKIIIATGTRPRRPEDIQFDSEVIFDSDTVLDIHTQPKSLLVLGAGVIGCEYASIFARMGVNVTLADRRARMLENMDPEIISIMLKHFAKSGIRLRLGTKFSNIKKSPSSDGKSVASIEFEGLIGKEIEQFDAILYCMGRIGNSEALNLKASGISADERGFIEVTKNYETSVANIYAVGDIIGSPALAASSAEQGRLASLHALTGATAHFPDAFPYGIYTIPEISSVGYQEAQLKSRGIPCVVGRAKYAELARGKMIGDEHGFLKLIVHAKTHRLVGIHVIGTSATELVHIGQVAMAFGANVEYFIENVFNYPTLAEAYKVAAYHAVNQLNAQTGMI